MENTKIRRTEQGIKGFMNDAIQKFNATYNADVEEVTFPVEFVSKTELNGALGRYSYYLNHYTEEVKPYKFQFFNKLMKSINEEHLNTMVLHELAHYITAYLFGYQADNGGHTEKWEEVCEMLGMKDISPILDLEKEEQPKSKWDIVCKSCGEVYHRDRMTKRIKEGVERGMCGCGKCGSRELEIKQNY